MAKAPSFFSDKMDRNASPIARLRDGDNVPPLTISEISAQLKRTIEDRFGHVRLRGEISGFKRAASGHIYLALKDDKAVIDAVIWRGNAANINFAAEDGLDVIATGKVTSYAGRSKYQIIISSLELAGEGALMQLFEKLKARLAAEGLFAEQRKRPLPFLPERIGVVTSPTGSVIRDILHRLSDRFPSHVLIWPALVQGEGAAQQIARGISGLGELPAGERPDLIIVARGGGSIEDLWSFNEEIVVRAIAASPIPVISAVGHETDTTLADYAADRRAPTPTAAAEIAVPVRAELQAQLDEDKYRGQKAVQRIVALGKERLDRRAERLPAKAALLAPYQQRLDEAGDGLARALALLVGQQRTRLAQLGGALRPSLLDQRWRQAKAALDRSGLRPQLLIRSHKAADERLSGLSRLLEQLSPDAPLVRGYARVMDAGGKTLTNHRIAGEQSRLRLKFADGELAVAPLGDLDGAGAQDKKIPEDYPDQQLRGAAPNKTKSGKDKSDRAKSDQAGGKDQTAKDRQPKLL